MKSGSKTILYVSVCFSTLALLGLNKKPVTTPLFRADQKSEWHTFLEKSGMNNDPKKVFQFNKNELFVSGEEFGYITTEKKYSDFHFTVEFKWGEKKYPPREKEKRDAGIMYHVDFAKGDRVWPRSLEFQVQEGDCGDFWMVDSTTIVYNDTLTTPKNYFRIAKTKEAERPNGQWNTAEVIVKNGLITHLLNGEIVNTAKLGNTKTGTILLQTEGAELIYRNAEVTEF